MPQIFQVLRCYKCSVFQVHQRKKSNKWQCKLCGEKQSIKRHYGLGTAKDCRLHVQKLNGIRGEIDELTENTQSCTDEEVEYNEPITSVNLKQPKKSRWSDYIDDTENNENKSDDGMYLDNKEVVLEIPKKIRKTFKVPKKDVDSQETIFQAPRESNGCEEIIQILNEKPVEPEQDFFDKAKYIKTLNTSLEVARNNKVSKIERIDISQCKSTATTDIQEKHTSTAFVPPKPNKYSKWAQYVESEEDNEEFDSLSLQDNSIANQNPQSLFSLCADEDIDDVLDI